MAVDKSCLIRLQREYRVLLKDPVPSVEAHPLQTNLLEWHYVLQGAHGSDYQGGVYHGKVVFPRQYPYKPPSIVMFTPNGRFATNQKLCLSMTDFHPESWNPMWSVGSILTGLLSFMHDDGAPTTGSISTTSAHKRAMAQSSLAFNAKNATFRRLYPSWVEEHKRREKEGREEGVGGGAGGGGRGREGKQQGAGKAAGQGLGMADGARGGGGQGAGGTGWGGHAQNQYLYYVPVVVAVVVLALGLMAVPFAGA